MMNFLSEMLPRMCISSKANSFSEDHKDSKGLASEKIKVQPQARPRPLARTSKKHVRRQRALAANTEQDREQFRKKVLDRAARKKSPPLEILESISEIDNGEMEPDDSDSDGETLGGASTAYSTLSMQEWRDSKVAKNPLRRSKVQPAKEKASASQPLDKPSQDATSDPPNAPSLPSEPTPPSEPLPEQAPAAPGAKVKRGQHKIPHIPSYSSKARRLQQEISPEISPRYPSPAKRPTNGPQFTTPASAAKRDNRLFSSLRESDTAALKIKPVFAAEAANVAPSAPPTPAPNPDPEQRVEGEAGGKPAQRANPISVGQVRETPPRSNMERRGARSIDGGWTSANVAMPRYHSGPASAYDEQQSEPAGGYGNGYHRFSRMPAKYSPEWLAALPPQFTHPQRHVAIPASDPPVAREVLPLVKSAGPLTRAALPGDPLTGKPPCGHPTGGGDSLSGQPVQIAASVGRLAPTPKAANGNGEVKLTKEDAGTQTIQNALRYYSREGTGGSKLRALPEGYFVPRSSPYTTTPVKQHFLAAAPTEKK